MPNPSSTNLLAVFFPLASAKTANNQQIRRMRKRMRMRTRQVRIITLLPRLPSISGSSRPKSGHRLWFGRIIQTKLAWRRFSPIMPMKCLWRIVKCQAIIISRQLRWSLFSRIIWKECIVIRGELLIMIIAMHLNNSILQSWIREPTPWRPPSILKLM